MARANEITVTVKTDGLQRYLERMEAAIDRLEALTKASAVSQICGILEAAARARA